MIALFLPNEESEEALDILMMIKNKHKNKKEERNNDKEWRIKKTNRHRIYMTCKTIIANSVTIIIHEKLSLTFHFVALAENIVRIHLHVYMYVCRSSC